jgi:mRNA (guanine-N7-)-methyltransferase
MKNTMNQIRNTSSIINLRRFHNWIKRKLIEIVSANLNPKNETKLSLLDLAVGKGGDIQKWYDNGIYTVVGIDKDINSIDKKDGANDRLRKLKAKVNVSRGVDYSFHVFDLACPSNNYYIDQLLNDYPLFDIMSCQFALHYFFKSFTTLNNLLGIISKYLRPGGYFIATTLDGDRVSKYIKLNSKSIFNLELGNDHKIAKDKEVYGQQLIVSSSQNNNHDTHYFQERPSYEYLVDINTLIKVCDVHHLSCIDVTHFDQWYKIYETEVIQNDTMNVLSNDEKKFSFLNFTITFIKRKC